MDVAELSLPTYPDGTLKYNNDDTNFLDNLQISREVKDVIIRAIIGGTDAWLDTNNDEEH